MSDRRLQGEAEAHGCGIPDRSVANDRSHRQADFPVGFVKPYSVTLSCVGLVNPSLEPG
jgi:hypothetical protein